MKVRRTSLTRLALARGNEFFEAVLQSSKCDAKECDVEDKAWLALLAKYPKSQKGFALGDAVAAVAQPIARMIDRLAGTDLQNCGGCKKRREALNKLTR